MKGYKGDSPSSPKLQQSAPKNTGRAQPANDLRSRKALGLVSNVLKTPAPKATQTRAVNIGVSFRNDSRGKVHVEHDREAIANIGKVKGVTAPNPQTLPKGASGPSTPDRTFGADTLKDIDMLYIPGGPYRNDTQTARDPSDKLDRDLNLPRKAYQVDEHESRAAYEKQMIQKAKTLGMPVMAVCAGTWRLLEAYGGEVETLPEDERSFHKAEDRSETWSLSHDVGTRRGTLLDSISRGKEDSSSNRGNRRAHTVHDVNSTHWAVAKTTGKSSGERLSQAPNQPLNPNDSLEISAKAKSRDKRVPETVEGVSSKHGAPVLGVQWHPESYLPGMPGQDKGMGKKAQERTENAKRIFTAMVQSAETYRNRKSVVAEIKSRVPKRD
ncbi:gamma-glutamyl-gamma-aminobutyrate hydrolase family protein [Alteromonas sp. a30]|uniref:gamma-glutamyl-gamma-aminobutyrate hydrolase family protein n=1 Tax=Alteromonas sp. a30 TaxID=2730917 RepID=UPI0022832B99|nr:gamma-glutamyl-gamma-aminobutyrate hydrolase family protein [Alteromonas sp. a30]MCY7296713.1 C26 family cysteine hydrolase domain-containing family [Alteromonas sp. a30]